MKEKKGPGRPLGSTKGQAKRDQLVALKLSPQGKAWFKAQPKGWLADWVEAQAADFNAKPSP